MSSQHTHIHVHFDGMGKDEAKKLLSTLTRTEKHIMATLAEVKAALALAAATAADEKAEVAEKFTALSAQIQELKDQIASGTLVTSEDLDALVSSIEGIAAAVEDITTPEVQV